MILSAVTVIAAADQILTGRNGLFPVDPRICGSLRRKQGCAHDGPAGAGLLGVIGSCQWSSNGPCHVMSCKNNAAVTFQVKRRVR